MSATVDAGPILLQDWVGILPDDNGETIRQKCGHALGNLAVRCVDLLSREPSYKGTPQSDRDATRIGFREALRHIDWSRYGENICAQVRALCPYPCAIFEAAGHELLLAELSPTNMCSTLEQAGTWKLTPSGKLLIATVDVFVEVKALRLGGRIRRDYANKIRDMLVNMSRRE
jgi:methionyl-tRNA formyltransferase